MAVLKQLKDSCGSCRFSHLFARGDFKVPSVCWIKDSPTNPLSHALVHLVTDISLSQLVNKTAGYRARHCTSLLHPVFFNEEHQIFAVYVLNSLSKVSMLFSLSAALFSGPQVFCSALQMVC